MAVPYTIDDRLAHLECGDCESKIECTVNGNRSGPALRIRGTRAQKQFFFPRLMIRWLCL